MALYAKLVARPYQRSGRNHTFAESNCPRRSPAKHAKVCRRLVTQLALSGRRERMRIECGQRGSLLRQLRGFVFFQRRLLLLLKGGDTRKKECEHLMFGVAVTAGYSRDQNPHHKKVDQ
jgi:hypothetical protein